MKRVLLAAAKAGYQTHAFGEAAARLGAALTLATDRCHVLDDPWRDRAVAVHFDEDGAALAPFDAVLAVGDRPAAFAARVAARQGLAFHPPAAVEMARNKFAARQRFAQAGLPTPEFFRVGLSEAEGALSRARFPCVLKPLGLSASRGVIRANNPEEFLAAYARIAALLNRPEIRAQQEDANRFIQVEDYIDGREFALEGLVRKGRLQTLALFDKPDPLTGPFFEETIYVTPSRESERAQQAILATAQRAIEALGFSDGPVHAEFRFDDDRVWPLELAARPIGGLCARALRFGGASMPLEELILRHALGEDTAGARLTDGATGVMMIPIPRRGVFERAEGVDEASATPLVTGVEITARPGQLFEPLPEGASYLGFVFARGNEAGEVERALRQAHRRLRIRLAEALKTV